MSLTFRLLTALLSCLLSSTARGGIEFAWPTPSRPDKSSRIEREILQPTGSGDPDSGGFGCVRSGGHRFHEGIDIKPTKRDTRGEAADEISAAMDGVVRHINTLSGESSYGRYIVIEHPDQTPAVYTLYAHLSKIAPGLSKGSRVKAGQPIGIMGRSAGGYAIPRDRAHLHFEIGLYLSQDFQSWYNWKKFGSPNQHSLWNGMNLIGLDPWFFFDQWRLDRVSSFSEHLSQTKTAVRLRVASTRSPDFITRYPSLLSGERPSGLLGGWEIQFSATGLPFRWTPLSPNQVAGMKNNEVLIVDTDEHLVKMARCKDLLDIRRGRKVPGKDLSSVLELLFGLRG